MLQIVSNEEKDLEKLFFSTFVPPKEKLQKTKTSYLHIHNFD